MKLSAREYGVYPEIDVSESLAGLLESLKTAKEPCTVEFETGVYFIHASRLARCNLSITNTVGDKEWKEGETPHENRVGILLKDLHHVTLEGNGAQFVIIGQATNMALIQCADVTVRNICLSLQQPDMHELEVVNAGLFFADFRLDEESRYVCKENQFYFVGEGYQTAFFDSRIRAHWIGKIDGTDLGNLRRTSHPFFTAIKIKEIGDHLFRAYYPCALRFHKKDRYEVFEVLRKYNGIFIDQSKNIRLDGVEQNANYGLALVAQNSDTLTFSHLRFAPRKGAPRLMASVADFLQICMCRGQVTVQDSLFEGSGDDCLNAHGIHFKIVEKGADSITVRFMHHQSHGFNPLRVGDRITYVNPETLLCQGESLILSSEMLDEYNIRLRLNDVGQAVIGHVIEDVDASPDLLFERNRIDRVITRGALLTIRGRVRVRDNVFKHTSMNNILISDDASHWYESGCVKDVIIENNTFQYCPAHTVAIQPENRKYEGPVHEKIIIRNNSVQTPSFLVQCAGQVEIYGNSSPRKEKIKVIHSSVNKK